MKPGDIVQSVLPFMLLEAGEDHLVYVVAEIVELEDDVTALIKIVGVLENGTLRGFRDQDVVAVTMRSSFTYLEPYPNPIENYPEKYERPLL